MQARAYPWTKRPGLVLRDASLRDAPQHEGHAHWSIQLSYSPASPSGFAGRGPRVPGLPGSRQTKSRLYRRASSPRMSLAPGLAVVVLSVFPDRGVRNVRAKVPRPRRPLARRAARVPFERSNNGTRARLSSNERRSFELSRPQKQTFTCVPHADGFVGLLDVPGLRASAPAPRSCELSPGHALEPSAPFAVVSPNASQASDPQDIRGRQSLRTSASRSTPRDHRDALRIGTGHGQNIPTRDKVKTNFQGRGKP